MPRISSTILFRLYPGNKRTLYSSTLISRKKKKKKKTSHANNGLDSLDPASLLINETERLPGDIYAKGEFFRND